MRAVTLLGAFAAGASTQTQQFTLAVTPAISFNYVSVVDASSPLAYFRLETPTGTGTSEVNGYTYNYSSTGASLVAGAPINVANNGGASLDGVSGDVTTSLSGGINTAGTMLAWINMNTLPSVLGSFEYIAGESEVGNDFDLQFTTDNVLRFYTTNNSQNLSYTPNASTLTGNWHMIVATFDNTAGKRVIYWDGVAVAADTTQSLTNKTGNFEIGQTSQYAQFGNRFFSGIIDEVAVWNYALSPAQVAQFYDIPLGLLPNGISGVSYGPLTMGAAGGSGSYSWNASGLPPGLSLTAAGVLSGTPTTTGTFTSALIQATDVQTEQNASQTFSITINPPTGPLTITTSLLSAGTQNTAYSQTLAATGGTGAYTWSVTSGALPAGLTLNASTGAITGTPTAAGSSSITIQVVDTGGNIVQQSYTLVVNPAVTITTTSLPNGALNVAYSQTVSATGGTGTYTWSISAGTLPAGLTLNPSTGLVSGTPTAGGTSVFTVKATDTSSASGTQQFTIVISVPLTITTTTLPSATQGTTYNQTLAATGGSGTGYTWSVTAGTVTQAGLTLASNGALSGTPNTTGTLSFTVQVYDSSEHTASQTIALPIKPSPSNSWDYAIVNEGSNVVHVSTNGLTPSIVCTGTPCHPLFITADSQGNIYSRDTTGIAKISPSGTVTPVVTLSNGVGGLALDGLGNIIFVDNLTDAVYRVSTSGANLTQVALFPVQSPSELQDTYVAVDSQGSYVVVSDDGGAVRVYRFTTAGAPTTVATFPGLTNGGLAIDTSGNYLFVDYSNSALDKVTPGGTLTTVLNSSQICCRPLGLTLDPVTGDYIIGNSVNEVATLLRVTAGGAITTIASGSPLTSIFGVAPVPATAGPLTVSPSTLSSSTMGIFYGPVQFSATGGSGSYTWSATGLPNGWSLTTSGSLSGFATAAGTYSVTVNVTDTVTGQTGTAAYSVQVIAYIPPTPPLVISGPISSFHTSVGGAVSASFTASGGTPPYTFSAAGLPPGVTMSPSGTLSGSPTVAGNYSGAVTVQDSHFTLAGTGISISVIGINVTSLPSGTAGVPYSANVSAVGGIPPYSFSATGLPPGLTLSSDGAVGGIPTTPGTFTITLSVTDSFNATASGKVTITIAKPLPVSISAVSLPAGQVNTLYSQSFTATGGFQPYTWTLRAGTLPPGLTLAASGIISGTPTSSGSFSFTIQVTDSSGGTATATVSLTIQPAPVIITTPSPLPSGMVSVEYPSQLLAAVGGSGTYSWSITSGTLPAGMTFTPDGALSGTPTAQGNFSLTFTATDTNGLKGSASFTLTVRPAAADLILSSGSLTFNVLSPAAAAPPAQAVGVESTQGSQQLSYTVSVSPAASWLNVTNGTATPDVITVGLTTAALSLTAGTYTTTITATCASGPCVGHTQSVTVTLTVTTTPPKLQILSDLLNFATTSATLSQITQSLNLENAGGGSLGIGSITCEAAWCTVGAAPSTVAGGVTVSIPITVDPSVTGPGFFRTQLDISTSGGKGSVPVTLYVAAANSLTLAPSGDQFIMQQGGSPGDPDGSFLVSTNSPTPISWTAVIEPGASWLKPGAMSGSSSATQTSSVTYSVDPVAASQLAAGAYYGRIEVTAPGIADSPIDYIVVLNVFPVTTPIKPNPVPEGLLFLTTVGINPPPQTVTAYSGATAASNYQVTATSDANWLSVSPGTGSSSIGSPGVTTVSVNVAGLKPGVYRGDVNFAFGGVNGIRSTNVTLIVSAVAGATGPSSIGSGGEVTTQSKPAAGSCTPSVLAPAQTGLVNNFSAPASWPTPLAVNVYNDCGSPVNNAQIVTTFSNGDAPLVLTLADPTQGLYAATWTPRKSAAQVTINAQATAPGLPAATIQLVGAVTPNAAPVLTPHGTLNGFDPVIGDSIAPGTIVQIYGLNLASQTNTPNALPLPTTVNGTSVIMGGIEAPLFFVSPTQVNAQVPFELQGGNQYQVVLQANGAITTPATIQLTPATPGIAAFSDGTIIAQHADGSLVSTTSPARSNEYLVAYLVGLGAVNQTVPDGAASPSTNLATTTDPVTLTVNGANYPLLFAGLTPGLVGLYQINFQVPAGLPAGTLTLYVTQDSNPSNQVFMPYQP